MTRGDSTALGLLYDRHAPLMLALCQRIAGGGAEAEDLVHEVFLEAWRRAGDYDAGRGSVRSVAALASAQPRARLSEKSARVSRRASGDERSFFRGARRSEPGAEPGRGPQQGATRPAGLALEQQRVLALGYFEGLSSSEIAERLSIPIGTVKSRTASALAALRQALLETGVHHETDLFNELLAADVTAVEDLTTLARALPATAPGSGARARLLAATQEPAWRWAPFFDRLGQLFELGEAALVTIAERAAKASEWKTLPCPVCACFNSSLAPRWRAPTRAS
jgi:RNA polymerase sigma-70 factor (ECF subfamily)